MEKATKTLNIPVTTTGSKICRWSIHGTTTNHPQTNAPCKTSHVLRLMIKSHKEFQDVLKVVETTVTQRTINNELVSNAVISIPNPK